MTENALTVRPMDKLRAYMRSDDMLARFAEVVGSNNASAYVSSVLLAVASNEALMACSPASIATAALRAATLRLSCDPSIGQAYPVPFKGKATLVIGYKGLKDMAIRTGRYRYLHVARVYDGQVVQEDQLRGVHNIVGARKADAPVIGYLLYFELTNGFSKTFYMTTVEILEHAKQYSKSYARSDSPWKTSTDAMMAKTVLRVGLSRWGYLDPNDVMVMGQIDDTGDVYDVEPGDVSDRTPKDEQKIMGELGFDEPEPQQEVPAEQDAQPEQPAQTPEPAKLAATPAPASQTNRQLIKVSPTYSCPKAWIDAVVAKWGAQKVNGFEAGKIFEKLDLNAEMCDEVATGAAGAYLIVRKQDPPGTTEEAIEAANGYIVACLNGMTENG